MENSSPFSLALAFSGGGYRASSFSLGMISYLHQVRLEDQSLLSCVQVLSTISGGTITGTMYAVGIKQGKTMEQIYRELYSFMHDKDLISLAIDRLSTDDDWEKERVKSLINAIADVYHKHLFKEARFGLLLNLDKPIHLKHISFNATEFANALQFRFQSSEKILHPKEGEPEQGIIGNFNYNIPPSVASEIRMADILAASSCFPGGFEPINFPTDFSLPESTETSAMKNSPDYPVGLMDGGIVDNQGIEPVLYANIRMERNIKDTGGQLSGPALDLIVVCDVTSPYMDDYKVSVQKRNNWWRKLTPASILTINFILLLSACFLVYFGISRDNFLLTVVASMLASFNLALFLFGRWIKGLPTKFKVPKAFLRPLGKLLRLKLLVYENLVMNRSNSLLKLSNDVFLKHIRQLNYARIFGSQDWKNRRIMTAIYELRKGEQKLADKIKSGTLPLYLAPSEAMQDVAGKASGMGTTLWFTHEELLKQGEHKTNLIDSVIACGQFTMCWNLLEYIEKIEKDDSNTNKKHQLFLLCKDQLKADWEKFKTDPYWMTRNFH